VVTGPYGHTFGGWLRDAGAKVVDLEVPFDRAVTADEVAEALERHPEIDFVSLVHAEAATGNTNPVGEIAAVASTGQISIRGGFRGPCGVLTNDEPGGLDAFATPPGRSGAAPTRWWSAPPRRAGPVLGGLPARLSELSLAAEPRHAYLPFTDDACGFSPAEGGAMLVLEDEDSARRRGARARAVVAGTRRPSPAAAAGPFRQGLARAIEGALAEAGCSAADVDVVFADALAVPDADRAEALALADALGPRRPRCRSPRPRPASAGPIAPPGRSTRWPPYSPWNTG